MFPLPVQGDHANCPRPVASWWVPNLRDFYLFYQQMIDLEIYFLYFLSSLAALLGSAPCFRQETLLAQMNAREADLGYGGWGSTRDLRWSSLAMMGRCYPEPHGHHEQDANVENPKKAGFDDFVSSDYFNTAGWTQPIDLQYIWFIDASIHG